MRIKGLIGKLYRFWHPHVDRAELNFYREQIAACEDGALELACGSGRLLLPYLKEGLDVDGVEASPDMVVLLRRKAERGDVTLNELYCQKLPDFSPRKQYGLIYCSLGSFQLITDQEEAKQTLKMCHRALLPGGRVIIALFLPWDEVGGGKSGWNVVSNRRLAAKGMRQIFREEVDHDPIEQVITARVRDELWLRNDLLEVKERTFDVRWYSRGEFCALLRDAGFHDIRVERKYQSDEQDHPSFMLFIASK